MRSLRGRLTLGVALVIAVVLGLAGVLVSDYTSRIARENLDDRLKRTAELSSATAVDAIQNRVPGTDGRLDAALNSTDSSLRLVVGANALLDAGRTLITGPAGPPGLRTITVDGRRLRVYVVALPRAGLGNLVRLEVASSLGPIERRQRELDQRLVRFGLLALLLGAAGAFLAAGPALGPLLRLRRATGRVADEGDLDLRVPESDGPREVRELAASFNAMLARLETAGESRERALAATRRFALDAGHELRTPLTTVQATLSALHRHPQVAAEQRTAMLGDALDEQRRLVTLLDGLQAYARGDASTVVHGPVDLADAVLAAAAEHGVGAAQVPDGPVMVNGWEPGLRLIVGNLIANAVRHGPPGGAVTVALTAGRVLTVGDEGAGVPEADRAAIFEPFARLPSAAAREGSGLGLALVAQQVREHGATIKVTDAPSRFEVRFPTGPSSGR